MKTEGRFFVLLRCGYDGDGNLFEDDFVACGSLEAMKHQVPLGAACYLPGQEVPDDGYYGDERARYRMIEAAPLGGTFLPDLPSHGPWVPHEWQRYAIVPFDQCGDSLCPEGWNS